MSAYAPIKPPSAVKEQSVRKEEPAYWKIWQILTFAKNISATLVSAQNK